MVGQIQDVMEIQCVMQSCWMPRKEMLPGIAMERKAARILGK
jgi:hypothetical protein